MDQFGELKEIDINLIVPNRFQPRETFNDNDLSELADSIREVGILQPLLVRKSDNGGYELIAGERRWRAARRADVNYVPVVVKEINDLGSFEQSIIENLHRSDLNCLEEAAAYTSLISDYGFTHNEVAKKVGKQTSTITNSIRLLKLPASVQVLLREESITAGHARAILKIEDPKRQELFALEIISKSMSVRQAETVAKKIQDPSKQEATSQRRSSQQPIYIDIEDQLSDKLSTTVEVLSVGKDSKIEIFFADEQDLERITEIIKGQAISEEPIDLPEAQKPLNDTFYY